MHVYHCHPGAVWTNIWDEANGLLKWIGHKIMITSEEGAIPLLYCALAKETDSYSGRYFSECVLSPSPVDDE